MQSGRGTLFKGGEKILVLLHIGKQRFNGKVGKLLALGLRNIKDGYNPVSYTHLDVYKRQFRKSAAVAFRFADQSFLC